MDQNTQNSSAKPLTFVDVIRMFKAKTVVVIVCLALVAAVLAGAVCALLFWRTTVYGSEITFYLSSKDGTHALLPLLNSDSFAEKLLLEENGLPLKKDCDEIEYNTALEWTMRYNEALEKKRESAKLAETLPAQVAEKKAIYDSDLAEYTRIYNLLNAYLNAYNGATANGTDAGADNPATTSDLLETIAKYEAELDKAADAVAKSKAEYNKISEIKHANDVTLANAKKDVNSTRAEMEKAVEVVLTDWRTKEDVRKKISVIRESVSFKYAKLNDTGSSASVDNENAAFLVITVGVENDEEMANFIAERIMLRTPDYVEKNVERITDVNDPSCTLISTFANTQEEDNSEMWIDAAVISGICGITVLVCSCFIVVIYNLLPDDMKRKKKTANQN